MLPKKILDEIDVFASKNNMSEAQKKNLMQRTEERYKKMQYEQSISEPATQMTMRSYTMATQSDRLSKVTQGLPRLIEIFDARKTFEKNMIIHLKKEYNDKDKARAVAKKIKCARIRDFVVSDSIDLLEMRLEIEMEKLDMDETKEHILKHVKDIEISGRGQKLNIKPKVEDLKGMRKIKEKIFNLHISGIAEIEDVFVIKEKDSWVIHTSGASLKKVLMVDEVDISKTRSNDIYEIAEVLGIEAARNTILNEIRKTLEEQGLDVDVRHVMLLSDIMTFNGSVKAIGRYGVSGEKSSVLAKANFEETKKHLVNAAFFGEEDKLRGITENVMIGQIAPIGTGLVTLIMDPEKLKKGVKKEK